MKCFYIECRMGAAGDMLTAALLELHPDPEAFLRRLNALGIPSLQVTAHQAQKCGVTGTQIAVRIGGAEEGEAVAEPVAAAAELAGDSERVYGHGYGHKQAHEHSGKHGQGCVDDVAHRHPHVHGCDHHRDHDHAEGHGHTHEPDDQQEHTHSHGHDDRHHHDEQGHTHLPVHRHTQAHAHAHKHTRSVGMGLGYAVSAHAHAHEHTAATLGDIRSIVAGLPVSESVCRDVLAVYALIAEAEGKAHNCTVEQVHFHEVGMLDAVADIVAVCMLLEELAPDKILASAVHVGSGSVRCSHGILPVPAPATAHILRAVPIYSGAVQGELCTPTGAALLKHFVSEFGEMPPMKVEKIGYGMGKKDFAAANCVRVFSGEITDEREEILELCCNLDDMTAEELGFAQEQLWQAGALDVFTAPISMKKNRPAVLLSCLCAVEQREKILAVLFRHTSSLGVREKLCPRYTLKRESEERQTSFGPVRIKISTGWGVTRTKIEYDDLAHIAESRHMSLTDARAAVLAELEG